MSLRDTISQRLGGGEQGFTILEVLVAVGLMLVGILGLLGSIDAARNLTDTSDLKTVTLDRAQREIERVQGLPFDSIAMSSIPSVSGTSTDPTAQINAGTSPKTFKWDPAVTTETAEALVTSGMDGATSAAVTPISTVSQATAKAAGSPYGYTVWRFVTRIPDSGVSCTSDTTKCPRRVTVVVEPDGSRGQIDPVWLSSIVTRYQAG